MKKARICREGLNILKVSIKYQNWLQKFKKHHGIKYLNIYDGEASTYHKVDKKVDSKISESESLWVKPKNLYLNKFLR